MMEEVVWSDMFTGNNHELPFVNHMDYQLLMADPDTCEVNVKVDAINLATLARREASWGISTGRKNEDLRPSSHNLDVPFVRHIEYQLLSADPDTREASLLTESGNLHLGSVKADLISVGDHVWLMDEQADEYEMTEDERLGIILDVEPRECPGGVLCRFGSEVLAFLLGEIELLSVHGRVDGRRRDLG